MATKSSSPPPCEEQPSTKKAHLQEDPHQETIEEQPSIEKAKSEADQLQEQQEQTEEKPAPGEGDKVAPAEAPIKSEECTNTDSEPDLKLRSQLEYYFGDNNLRFDDYLKEQIVKGDGWVPVAEFLKFDRVLQLTKDVTKLVAAIEASQLLELSECKTKVRQYDDQDQPEKSSVEEKNEEEEQQDEEQVDQSERPDGEQQSDDEDDVQVTIDDVSSLVNNLQREKTQRRQQPVKPKAGIDLDATGDFQGQPIIDVNLDQLEDKPWRKPGADISDYFNYGFNEDTWKLYCDRQKKLRSMNDEKQPNVETIQTVAPVPTLVTSGGSSFPRHQQQQQQHHHHHQLPAQQHIPTIPVIVSSNRVRDLENEMMRRNEHIRRQQELQWQMQQQQQQQAWEQQLEQQQRQLALENERIEREERELEMAARKAEEERVRERERKSDRDRGDRMHDRERGHDRDREKRSEKDRGKDRERDRDKDRSKDKSRDRDRERDRSSKRKRDVSTSSSSKKRHK